MHNSNSSNDNNNDDKQTNNNAKHIKQRRPRFAMSSTNSSRVFVSRGLNFRSSEGVMMRLETLIELKFDFSIRALRAYPLTGIRQAVPCRAIRGDSISVDNTLPALFAPRPRWRRCGPCSRAYLMINIICYNDTL